MDDQPVECCAQGFGEFLHVIYGDVALTALDAAHIIAVEPSQLRKVFL